MTTNRKPERVIDNEPIHSWFELSYSNYLVLPRLALQSMPAEWQHTFVACLEELEQRIPKCMPDGCSSYYVMPRDDETGRLTQDPYSDYERGRARLPLKEVDK